MRSHIDLNCDLGEGAGIEAAILPYVSTINIACGAHAGDKALIRNTIRLAKEQQVAIGAHPSYPDRENFGRVVMSMGKKNFSDLFVSRSSWCEISLSKSNTPLHMSNYMEPSTTKRQKKMHSQH